MKIFFLLVLILVGCEETPEYVKGKKTKIRMAAATQDIVLPAKLWAELEAIYKPLILDQSRVEEEGSRVKLELPKEFFPFSFYLNEKNKGVLKQGDHELIFEKGGGVVDLANFLTDQKGSFHVAVRPQLELDKNDKVMVFYLSNAKRLNIDGEVHGAGCTKYMDITNYFTERMKKEGILANTTSQRHVALLVGTYFFAASIKGKLYLSQLTIKDSRFKKLHCTWK
ncbi:MAG: hypothetical protein AB7F59_13765 [Bdellovibrionales bacterium]